MTLSSSQPVSPNRAGLAKAAMHWYDLTCPFCYISQDRNEVLEAAGLTVVDLPFRAHPEVPADGIFIGPRHGAMYDGIEQEARRQGLPLSWPDRLPPSRHALGVAEWVRVNQPPAAKAIRHALFTAHFAGHRDISDPHDVRSIAGNAGVDLAKLDAALAASEPDQLLSLSEQEARRIGISGTPAWLVDHRLISGAQPVETFRDAARRAAA